MLLQNHFRSCGNFIAYLYLAIAIVAEVIATNALKSSEGFTQLLHSIRVVAGYAVAFYCISLVLELMPVGIAYAIWAGLGIVLVTIVAAIVFKQIPDWPAIAGMTLIVAGVLVINLYSSTASH